MTARVSDYKDSLYHREYSNDVPCQKSLIKRVALAALPFLCLHRSFRMPVAIGMGSLRVWNSCHRWEKAGAVIALASTFFRFRAGQIFTTVQDIALEAQSLRLCRTKEEAVKCLIKILNNLVYLALISRGGLELSILSFVMQAVVNLLQSRDEFRSERWIEGCANVLMAAVRLKQTYGQCQQLQRSWEIEEAVKRFHVGELHEKWRFPSDHLPVGIEVDGVKIISWNVLNNAYMSWVTDRDSQGLNGSLISDLDQPVGSSGLTMRDVVVADMVQTMMNQGQVVALQECSHPFVELLAERLPSNWQMVRSFDTPQKDQAIILYNAEKMFYSDVICSETSTSAYPSAPGRPVQNAFFWSENGMTLSIINAHIPGDPTKPGKEEFAQYVYEHHKGWTTVALGDNNFERDEMMEAYRKAGFTDFSLHSPWKTNIDPYTKESKAIDHFFVVGTDTRSGKEASSRDLSVEEVLPNGQLQNTVDLLNPVR